jgi:hypothetical protein
LLLSISALLIVIGVALYPLGWGNKEVLDACADESGPYQLGKKHIFVLLSINNKEKLCYCLP